MDVENCSSIHSCSRPGRRRIPQHTAFRSRATQPVAARSQGCQEPSLSLDNPYSPLPSILAFRQKVLLFMIPGNPLSNIENNGVTSSAAEARDDGGEIDLLFPER
jgi:hypothetical protein